MGVLELWSTLMQGIKSEHAISFNECRGETVAIDISIFFYKLLKRESNVLCRTGDLWALQQAALT